ncbi:hypothetical protein Runsl_3453 [Runella slithyformis DSM 19594]|uniref:Uncharacterized protein n=1 Tax=Runella slithyformis (strain ATCC 29530 / DSM 19594 / LMG 11500 / NCIMB 11436 / LSU 4) TaxID=761193 RepID=A0A7U3ZMA6_RUNSL|nr:hypothetical protein Runsl_3453 [Runella slithyformis DSM 19594]
MMITVWGILTIIIFKPKQLSAASDGASSAVDQPATMLSRSAGE